MAGTRRTDLLGRLQDISEEALQGLRDAPGADKVFSAVSALRDRTDDLQKRVRGLEKLEQRLAAVERKVERLSKSGASSASSTRKSTKTTSTKSSGGSTAKKS